MDVLLQKVAEGLERLATSIQRHIIYMSTTPSLSSRQQLSCPLLLEQLLLLHCRSKDVLVDFSGYYCLRLLLDVRSPHATYFIALFHQLEWLLEALRQYLKERKYTGDSKQNSNSLPVDLVEEVHNLLSCIKPTVNSCRELFLLSEISKPADGITFKWRDKYEPSKFRLNPKSVIELHRARKEIRKKQEEVRKKQEEDHMKRKAKAHRDFPMDRFRAGVKLLHFGNLDNHSKGNRVEVKNKKLGEGSYAVVYEGKFFIGEPVAVKMFRSGEISESEGSISHTRELGSQFFKRMEAMVELKTGSHNMATDFFRRTEKMTTDELLSEELWKLVTAKHPNVVSARGYIGRRNEGESGLVMELMDTSLQKHLEKVAEPLSEQEMVDIMLETAQGMRFLHECDLVHKDLKPQNILLRFGKQPLIDGRRSTDGAGAMEVTLADFGLAQRIVTKGDAQGSETDICDRAGTYCYMAPELLGYSQFPSSSNEQDKMDVFSYGTVCFNILTCQDAGALHFTCAVSKASAVPFYEAARSHKWKAFVKGKPEYLIDLIARCWAFDPSERPTFAAICCLLQLACHALHSCSTRDRSGSIGRGPLLQLVR